MAPFDPEADPVHDAIAIAAELEKYDPTLAEKPRWLILNKLDLIPEEERQKRIDTQEATDKYQYAIKQTKQAQIKYLINQAKIRNSELKGTSVQEFLKTLKDIKADQKGLMLENVEVSAYASPEGSVKFKHCLGTKPRKIV